MNDALPIIVANLKANKTWNEMIGWFDVVGPKAENFVGTVVICPSFAFLASSSQKIKAVSWPLKLGSQDVSRFTQGAYTGEVAASQIVDLVSYAIIGHSERRQNFDENEITLSQKVTFTKKAGIEPIFCVQSSSDPIPQEVAIVVYEPVFAIGTGNPDTPQNVQAVAKQLKEKGKFLVLYGGSVSGANVKQFLSKGLVDGVLVGATNSLDPANFIRILESASY